MAPHTRRGLKRAACSCPFQALVSRTGRAGTGRAGSGRAGVSHGAITDAVDARARAGVAGPGAEARVGWVSRS
ncbi:hypothetical protein UVI_02062400 [Ustilaginoidea virens]|uniref:Uncharacterized protein n=1 Tax=Ustilaginoidea virens TaxID=1159556 RepID=A0A1B5L9B1_USTVR|nr:hypothetical protein UVI_02062400 [Ustilaginoidea virens]